MNSYPGFARVLLDLECSVGSVIYIVTRASQWGLPLLMSGAGLGPVNDTAEPARWLTCCSVSNRIESNNALQILLAGDQHSLVHYLLS